MFRVARSPARFDEKVRHAITKLADLHLVSSDRAAERVVRMGENPDRVFVTGCPSIDLARLARDAEPRDIDAVLSDYGGVGSEVDISEGYIVVLQHPVTTEYELALDHVTHTLSAVREGHYPTLWFWPNVDAGSDGTSKGIRVYREHYPMSRVHFYKNMTPLDFLSVLINSKCLVGNSSVAIRECAYLGVPAVNIGSRQHGRDRGRNVIDVGYDEAEIRAAIDRCWTSDERGTDTIYGDGEAGRNIADVIAKAELSIEKTLNY